MNSNLLQLFRALITGGELTDLENALGDGLGVRRRHALADVTSARNRSTLALLSLNEYPLDLIQVNPPSLTRMLRLYCSATITVANMTCDPKYS